MIDEGSAVLGFVQELKKKREMIREKIQNFAERIKEKKVRNEELINEISCLNQEMKNIDVMDQEINFSEELLTKSFNAIKVQDEKTSFQRSKLEESKKKLNELLQHQIDLSEQESSLAFEIQVQITNLENTILKISNLTSETESIRYENQKNSEILGKNDFDSISKNLDQQIHELQKELTQKATWENSLISSVSLLNQSKSLINSQILDAKYFSVPPLQHTFSSKIEALVQERSSLITEYLSLRSKSLYHN